MRLPAVLILVSVMLTAGAAGPNPQYPWSTNPSVLAAVCAEADRLTNANNPQGALDIIDRVRAGAPPALPAPVPSTQAGDIAAVSQACEPQRLTALTAAAKKLAGPDAKAPAVQYREQWDAMGKDWLGPLQGPGIAFLGLVAGLLVLARLGALLPGFTPAMVSQSDQKAMFRIGLASILVGVAAIVCALPYAFTSVNLGNDTTPVMIPVVAINMVLLIAFTCYATYIFAQALASKLRLNIEVHNGEGKPDVVAGGQLIAMLSELGAKPPAGLEVPSGFDVTTLKDAALVTTPDQKLVAMVHQLIQFIFSATPWSVVVDGDESCISVLISRNGRAVAAVLIKRDEFDLFQPSHPSLITPGPVALETKPRVTTLPSLNKMAAALVLTTLATRHDGFDGLCGAKDWRSVGLHYIATTEYGAEDNKQAVPLLAAAMDYDPDNGAASLALHHHLYRMSHEKEDLRFYVKWLKQQEIYTSIPGATDPTKSTKPGFLDMRRRILMNYVIAVLNLRSLKGCESAEPDAKKLAELLEQLLTVRALEPDLLAEQMLPVAQELSSKLKETVPSKTPPAPMETTADGTSSRELKSPRLAYNRACAAAQDYARELEHCQAASENDHHHQVKEHCHACKARSARKLSIQNLKEAVLLPLYKDWARKDPSLSPLHPVAEFGELVGTAPRKDFWELGSFKTHQKLLVDSGVPTPASLSGLAISRPYLRRYLNLAPAQFRHLRSLSELIKHAENYADRGNPGFAAFEVEIIDALGAEGIERPEELCDAKRTAANIVTTIKNKCLRAPDESTVESWLREWKRSAPSPGMVNLRRLLLF